jgi:F-type H+-transporting ATPase subunit epsilon
MNKLLLTILTPNRVLVENLEVESITIPAWEGEMCVLPGHIPYMAQLREGILKYKNGTDEEYLSIFWGFFEVYKNKVTILAEDANTPKDIDEEKTRQEYQRAKDAMISKDKKENLDELEAQMKKMMINLKLMNIRHKNKNN